MKIGLISDIHGNYEALKVVLNELDLKKVDKIYCLGDVVGYYSQVNECCEALIERDICCVMGNHDWYLASGTGCPRSKSANDCLRYQRTIIKPMYLNWLRSFPVVRVENKLNMVHGGWDNPIDEYLHEINDHYFQNIAGEFFVSGHTHVQTALNFNGKQYCNPGSVGQPRDWNPKAAYAIFENDGFSLFRCEYYMEKVFELMKKAGFDDYYYGGLKYGSRNLRKLD
jgi:putative phosphoesterase